MPGSAKTSNVHRRDALLVLGIVVLGSAFLYEMLSMDAVPVARDIQLFFIPHKHILWDALQQRELPLWTPLIETGYPVLANFQSGVFYPPHWLYGVLPFLPAFNLLIVAHLILGGVGGYLLARELYLRPVAALVAGVAFMLGGYFVSLTNLVNHLQTAAWGPLMVAVFLRHVRQWRTGTFTRALLVYVMAFLAGAPQTFVLFAVLALAVGIIRTQSATDGGGRRAKARAVRSLLTMAGLALCVAALTAVQLLPTLEMIGHSSRAEGLVLSEAGRYSLSSVRLLHLVVPNSFADPEFGFGMKMQLDASDPWLYSVYLGVVALVLAWHARWKSTRRAEITLWVAVALSGVVLGLGRHTPIFEWLHGHLPGMSAFRFPEKFLALTGLAVPVLAGYGTSALTERPALDRVDGIVALCVLTGGLTGKLWWSLFPDQVHAVLRSISSEAPALEHFGFSYAEWGAQFEIILGILAIAVLLVLLVRRRDLSTGVFMGLIVVLLGLDYWIGHRGLNPTLDPSFYREEPAVLSQLPEESLRTDQRWRATRLDELTGQFWQLDLSRMSSKWYWQQTMQPNTAALWGVLGYDSSDAIHLNSVLTASNLMADLSPERRLRLLRLGSVSHLYALHPLTGLDSPTTVRGDSVPGVIYQLDDAVPRAYLAHGQTFTRKVDVLNAALHPSTDYRREVALLTSGSAGLDVPEVQRSVHTREDTVTSGSLTTGDTSRLSDPGSAELIQDTGETVRIRVRPDTTSYAVLTDTWYPGWEVYVDGERRTLHRANYFFRAVRVFPGDRNVVFRYRPESFRLGRNISVASVLVLTVGGLAWWRRKEAREGPE